MNSIIGLGSAIIPTTTKSGGGGKGAVDTVKISVSSPTGTVSQPEPSTCQVIDGLALVSVKLDAQQGQQNAVKQITTPTGVLKPDQVSGNLNMDAATLAAYTKNQTDAVIAPVAQQASQAKDSANQANITANQAVATANQTKADLVVLASDVDDIVYNLNNMKGQIISDNISGTLLFDYNNLQIILTENVVPSKLTMFVKSVAGALPDLNGDAKPTPEQLDTYSQETIDSDFDSQQQQISQQGQQLQTLILRFDTQTGEITSPDGTVVGSMTWDEVNAKWTLSLRADQGGVSTLIKSDTLKVDLIQGGYKINLGINPDQFNFVQEVLNFIGTTGSQYLFTDGLHASQPDPETKIITVTAQPTLDIIDAISQQQYIMQLKQNIVQNFIGIKTDILLGGKFSTEDEQSIMVGIYNAIGVSGSNLTLKLVISDVIIFDIPFTQTQFSAFINLHDVAEYIQTYCKASIDYPLQTFLCFWDSAQKLFIMTCVSNEINIYSPCDNTNAIAIAMNLTQLTLAKIIYVNSVDRDGTMYYTLQNVQATAADALTIANQAETDAQTGISKAKTAQQTADATNTELTDNDTIKKANEATQQLSSSDDSVEIIYTGRNADLKAKGGSGMNANIGYKQYKWNNLVSADYNISVIDEQLISVASINHVTIKEVQYSNKINFSITGLTKSQLIGNNQYYAFIGLINTEESLPKNSYYQGAVASSLAVIQQAVATDPFIWIYWKYQGQTISYNITLTSSNVATIDALLTRVNTAIKQQYPYMSLFEFNYGVRTNKFYMKVNNPDVTFTTEGISQGGYDTNLACGVCVQSLSSSVFVLNSASTGVGGLSNISNNRVWVSDQFLLTDTATLTHFTVATDYFSFTADFSKLTNDAIASALFANNIALISVESNNATELENTLFYPNRSAQNFAGSPYFPISFIKSSVLLDQNTITYSPIVLAIYNGKDYAENIDKIVSITIDLSKYPINQKEFSQFINFQFNSVLSPAEHFVQLIVNASNTDYTINGLKVYTSPLVKVLNYNEEKNVDGNITKVSNKIFMLKCNQNDIAVFAPSSDVSSSAVTGLAVWDSNKAYAVNDIVSMQNGTDMGVFIALEVNIGKNPWSTNSWLPYGGINTYHLTNTTYQVSSGVNMVMVSAPENQDVVLELPQISQIKDTWSCTFKACNLTNGNKISIYGFHDISGHDVFENGSDVIEMINASDILTVYIRNGDNKIYYSLG